uniref:Myc target protein 1 homolog n=1 Tax=Sinocyclocheilus rhinocerous TaxID=307959 RepID=A0A673NMY2_9TELE
MADNSTHPIVKILESFGLSKIFYHIYTLYKEFALAYTQINSQCYKVNFVLLKKSGEFSFHRQTSSSPIDYGDSPGRKSSFRASTFHPLLQCSQIAREAEEGSQGSLPRTPTFTTSPGAAGSTSTVSSMVTPPRARTRPDSFWGNSNLRGFHAGQIPPPAYESIIRAYQETTT